MPERKPNLLFLMTDHQRADSIGMVQAGIEVTPNLNRLAAGGACFRRAYNTCPLCVPARTALFTGKYPTRNGVVYNDWAGDTAGNHKPLQQYLSQAGYTVGRIGVDHIRVHPPVSKRVPFAESVGGKEWHDCLERRGLEDGLPGGRKRFKRTIEENVEGRRSRRPYSNTKVASWQHRAEHFKDMFWCRRAARFIEAHEGPFALFLYLWAPHPPLVVPEPYASKFEPKALELPENVDRPAEGEPAGRRRGAAAQIAEAVSMSQWRRVWAAHLGLVNMADAGLGMVLEALEAAGHADETAVVFTVDHGDHLGQHRMYQKMELYEQAVRVPLIFRFPGAPPGEFERPVWHLNVMPTVLELLGLPMPTDLDAGPLTDTVLGGEPPPNRALFMQYSGNPSYGDIRRGVVTRRWKYVYDPNDEAELYDLENDPLETRNLADEPEHLGMIYNLHSRCAAWHGSHGDWVSY